MGPASRDVPAFIAAGFGALSPACPPGRGLSRRLERERGFVPSGAGAPADPPGPGRGPAGHGVFLFRALSVRHAGPRGVEPAPDGVRAHGAAGQRGPVAEVPQAAERHVADGGVGARPAFHPVEDRADAEIVPVHAETRLDLP